MKNYRKEQIRNQETKQLNERKMNTIHAETEKWEGKERPGEEV